jgi:hypothetical protein
VVAVCAGAAAGGAATIHLAARPRLRVRPRDVAGGTADGPKPAWRGPQGAPSVLVVASEPVDLAQLRPAVTSSSAVLVVAPAFTRSGLRFWVSDMDEAIARAREVKEASVNALRDAGVAAEGHVGSGDPVRAIQDALRFFHPDLILLSLHGAGRRRYRERPLGAEVERRFGRPVAELDPSPTRSSP